MVLVRRVGPSTESQRDAGPSDSRSSPTQPLTKRDPVRPPGEFHLKNSLGAEGGTVSRRLGVDGGRPEVNHGCTSGAAPQWDPIPREEGTIGRRPRTVGTLLGRTGPGTAGCSWGSGDEEPEWVSDVLHPLKGLLLYYYRYYYYYYYYRYCYYCQL